MARVQVFGEVSNLGVRAKAVYFELRDQSGALPCSMWRTDYDRIGVELENGAQVVLAGGCDYYPGSATSSPSFSFRATRLRVAGEGELLAQIERLRRKLDSEGLFEPQKAAAPTRRCHAPSAWSPASGARPATTYWPACAAGAGRGRLVWAFAPVQDRRAAPLITRALQDLAAVGEVDAIVVARGGGSVMDLMAFSDETLCRTVAMLAVPVIASVGHHTDRTLIDDVASVSCSTPTHAAESAVRLDCRDARRAAALAAARLERGGRRAVVERARRLTALSRAPAEHLASERRRMHQRVREVRAAGGRRVEAEREISQRRLLVLSRQSQRLGAVSGREDALAASRARELHRGAAAAITRRARDLERLSLALAAHDPERTLERGYALVEGGGGAAVTSAAEARREPAVSLRFADGRVNAAIDPGERSR